MKFLTLTLDTGQIIHFIASKICYIYESTSGKTIIQSVTGGVIVKEPPDQVLTELGMILDEQK